MNELVLAIRLGPASRAPTEVAVRLARETGAHVTVLYILAELEAIELGAAQAGMDPGQEHQRVLAEAEAGLNAFLAEHLAGVPAAGRLERGKVEDRVAEVAAELDARFIVVGTRGRGALARLVLGDVVQGILQRTPCPVIVVPLGGAQG
jgi:nucleotide-binding universal stress UspA family protein